MPPMNAFTVTQDEEDETLAAVLRGRLSVPWSTARALCQTHKIQVNGTVEKDPATRVHIGQNVAIHLTARKAAAGSIAGHIVFENSQVVVLNKPAGMLSVPYERGETGTAMDLVRKSWRAQGRHAEQQPLYVVHRIDKETSGLLLFAKTRAAERVLTQRFRHHDIRRRYLCVVHGYFLNRTLESYLLKDRGDGLRGSVPGWKLGQPHAGRLAISQVEVLEHLGTLATVCAVQIETGKTHQIRIHLAEAGHPIIGERVYIRDFLRRGNDPLPCPRLLLHAETLGFALQADTGPETDPDAHNDLLFQEAPPQEFTDAVSRLRTKAHTAPAAKPIDHRPPSNESSDHQPDRGPKQHRSKRDKNRPGQWKAGQHHGHRTFDDRVGQSAERNRGHGDLKR